MAPTMKLSALFLNDVTRDISPVVYFHDQAPEKLKAEVGEYIITGGYPDDDPRKKRVPHGIHEAYVRLLREITRRLKTQQGVDLPASWISGFYGSGKSSFAKLLGLSLDNRTLPNGSPLDQAWIKRDTSPLSKELEQAWQDLKANADPIAVVFDIGGEARDNEHIHAATLRQVQRRLGYSKDRTVADYELKLERDGKMQEFLAKAEEVHGEPWAQIKNQGMADDKFSLVMHHLFPEMFEDPQAWVDSRSGTADSGISSSEAVRALGDMLNRHAPGKTLFVVVDEVSQYIHKSDARMLALQSFVSGLGQRLHGKVWLMVTGQEKLDAQNNETVIGKMKDRFPESLRVHLGTINIRDVVHKRLLQKKPEHNDFLRAAFQKHRTKLKLHAFGCEHISEEDFVEVYPMLPGHIDLLLQITSALRSQVSRAQGDNHAIRGLLQLLGELFRAHDLANAPVGRLITLDDIYEIQGSALSGASQATMARILSWTADNQAPLALRVAKAVALLQVVQDQRPTTEQLVARCLYDTLDRGDNTKAIRDALEQLRTASLLSYSEKRGYKLQSGAGQEWDTERDRHGVTLDQISSLVKDKLQHSVAPNTNPRLKGVPFRIQSWLSDGRQIKDEVFRSYRNEPTFNLDLQLVGPSGGDKAAWIRRSAEERLRNRLVWVVGPTGQVHETGRALARSTYMINRYQPQQASLSPDRRALLIQEQSKQQDLDALLGRQVEDAFFQGSMYFRGRQIQPSSIGASFATALMKASTDLLPSLYPHFESIKITKSDMTQLLNKDLSGVSPKFLTGQLGILSLDEGNYLASCDGPVPSRILQNIEESGGTAGSALFAHFAEPPYGFSPVLIRACLAGLLRGGKIRIRPDSGQLITSLNDPGVKDLFDGDRALRRADLLKNSGVGLGRKQRVAICRFFKDRLNLDVDRDNDAIADAVFQEFPRQSSRLRQLLTKLNRLPGHVTPPPAIDKLGRALEVTQSSRQIEPTVIAVNDNLDALNDGIEQLGIWLSTLNDQALEMIQRLSNLSAYHIPQLELAGKLTGDALTASERIQTQLKAPRPWDGATSLQGELNTLTAAYLAEHERLCTEQVTAEERVREKIRAKKGFDDLDPRDRHTVLAPLSRPSQAMDRHATQPTLLAMRDQARIELQEATAESWELLDGFLNPGVETVRVPLKLSNHDVSSLQELDELLDDLRSRVALELKAGRKVRLK